MGARRYCYFTAYQPDIDAALQALREAEFKAGRYTQAFQQADPPLHRFALTFPPNENSPAPGPVHPTIKAALDDATEEGTCSILDLTSVADQPGACAVSPVSADDRRLLLGTAEPSREQVERVFLRGQAIGDPEATMDFMSGISRGQGRAAKRNLLLGLLLRLSDPARDGGCRNTRRTPAIRAYKRAALEAHRRFADTKPATSCGCARYRHLWLIMRAFAELLDRLYFTHSNLAKAALLHDYFMRTPDPDRGYAVAAIAGELRFDLFKRALMRDLMAERIDATLFAMSYDYVGEMSETIAHLWPSPDESARPRELPPLHEVIAQFRGRTKPQIRVYLAELLDIATPRERWALLKLGTQTLRIGISARFVKRILADYGKVAQSEVEEVWHGLSAPYENLFAWLEKRGPKPDTTDQVVFHPVMLSNALDDAAIGLIAPDEYQAEWKYDGIRVQMVSLPAGRALFSRTGDDVSGAFPDLLGRIDFHGVLDGELVVRKNGQIGSFNDLQQRLNRKTPGARLVADTPGHLIVYDALRLEDDDLRALPLTQRRQRLETWHAAARPDYIDLSQLLPFDGADDLTRLRAMAPELCGAFIEGLMLKRKSSAYVAGRPQGQWYKWKRDPLTIDAVLMYAQRGSGKRSSFYSDYTFGLWRESELLPVGKAYFGFTDEELRQLDRWVRGHTVNRFGPVREVEKALVFEVAFDSVHASTRHKSGVAMRFPRISRIRWDKPAMEADMLDSLEKLIR